MSKPPSEFVGAEDVATTSFDIVRAKGTALVVVELGMFASDAEATDFMKLSGPTVAADETAVVRKVADVGDASAVLEATFMTPDNKPNDHWTVQWRSGRMIADVQIMCPKSLVGEPDVLSVVRAEQVKIVAAHLG